MYTFENSKIEVRGPKKAQFFNFWINHEMIVDN